MTKKYICMAEGCDFFSEDEKDSVDHMDLGHEHEVVKVITDDHVVKCEKIGHSRDLGEGFEEEF